MRYTDQEVETKLNASVIQLLIHQIEPMDRNIHSCHLNPDFPEDITHLPVTQMSNEAYRSGFLPFTANKNLIFFIKCRKLSQTNPKCKKLINDSLR